MTNPFRTHNPVRICATIAKTKRLCQSTTSTAKIRASPRSGKSIMVSIASSEILFLMTSRIWGRPWDCNVSALSKSICLNNSASNQCSEWWKLTQPSMTLNCTIRKVLFTMVYSWNCTEENLDLSNLPSAREQTMRMWFMTLEIA